MLTSGSTDHDDARASSVHRLAPAERLRRLADLWPSFDDEERALLESRLHRWCEPAPA